MLLSPPLLDRLVLTLAHFLWQGGLLALLAWLLIDGLGIRSVHKRYAAAFALLVACLVLPCVTFVIVKPGERSILSSNADSVVEAATVDSHRAVMPLPAASSDRLPVIIPGPSIEQAEFGSIGPGLNGVVESELQVSGEFAVPSDEVVAAPSAAVTMPPLTWLQRYGNWVVLAWVVGVVALTLRLVLATASATVLRWRGRPVDVAWRQEIERLATLMQIKRSPTARISKLVKQVCVVGLYRPVILFPATWVSGVPSDVLEAVIAHELAHIRRHDVWVIHLQRVVETLLFFHPAVWWMSRQVSRHRELCCDADAAAVLGSPVRYAMALEYVALREYSGSQSLFMATLGGRKMELLERIQTVLGAEPIRPQRWRGSLAACLVIAAIFSVVVSLAVPGLATSEADDDPAVVVEVDEPSIDELPPVVASGIEDLAVDPGDRVEPVNVADAEPETFNPSQTSEVIERLRAAGITFEHVCEGSERYRIAAGLTDSDEYEGIARDFRHLQVGGLLHQVLVAEQLELSLDDFEMGTWHQRRLQADLGYLPDELDVIGVLPIHPQLRRLVLHNGAFEFITPQSQCSPEELEAIEAECTSLPIESSFHYDQQFNGVTWRVHGFRERPWLIVVEDISPRATVAAVDDPAAVAPSLLTDDESAAIERLRAAGCDITLTDGIRTAVVLPDELDVNMVEDLVRLRDRVEAVTVRGVSISENDMFTRALPALQTLEILDGQLLFRRSETELTTVQAARILVEIDHELEGGIKSVSAEDGRFVIERESGELLALQFSLMRYDVLTQALQLEGGVRGIGRNGTSLSVDSMVIDLSVISGQAEASETTNLGDPAEQVVKTYSVARLLTSIPGSDGEATQESIDTLIRLIRTQVPAESWVDIDGPRIEYFAPNPTAYYTPTLSLVITQDRATHERIRQFLEDLELLLGGVESQVDNADTDLFHTWNDHPVISPREATDEIASQAFSHPIGPGELAITRALNETTSIISDGYGLHDVMRMFANQHEINIVVDHVALNELGVTSDTPVELELDGISLRSALKIILDPLDLGFQIDDEVLMITSQQKLEGELSVRTYAVGDILDDGPPSARTDEDAVRLQRLVDVVASCNPDTWSERGGAGSILPYSATSSLVIRQTAAGHREVIQLLDALRGRDEPAIMSIRPGESCRLDNAARITVVSGHALNVAEVIAISPTELEITGVVNGRTSMVLTYEFGESKRFDIVVSDGEEGAAELLNAEEQIEQALRQRIALMFEEVPLADALRTVSEQLGINIVLEEPGLNEVGLTTREPVSLSLGNISGRKALELMLDPLQLGFVIQDEVLLVTSRSRLDGRYELVAYNVSGLVDASSESAEHDLEELAKILRTTVAPNSWDGVGGQGSIAVVPWQSMLVVRQSPARHEAVAAVLASLRQAPRAQHSPASQEPGESQETPTRR